MSSGSSNFARDPNHHLSCSSICRIEENSSCKGRYRYTKRGGTIRSYFVFLAKNRAPATIYLPILWDVLSNCTLMPDICIYTRPAGLCAGNSASFDSEHWFSRGLGEFQNFEELDGKVCKDCNNLFGRQLEDVFLHSGPEALFREIAGGNLGRKSHTKQNIFERGAHKHPAVQVVGEDPDAKRDIFLEVGRRSEAKAQRQVIIVGPRGEIEHIRLGATPFSFLRGVPELLKQNIRPDSNQSAFMAIPRKTSATSMLCVPQYSVGGTSSIRSERQDKLYAAVLRSCSQKPTSEPSRKLDFTPFCSSIRTLPGSSRNSTRSSGSSTKVKNRIGMCWQAQPPLSVEMIWKFQRTLSHATGVSIILRHGYNCSRVWKAECKSSRAGRVEVKSGLAKDN